MALLLEEREEAFPDLGRRAHGGHCRCASGPCPGRRQRTIGVGSLRAGCPPFTRQPAPVSLPAAPAHPGRRCRRRWPAAPAPGSARTGRPRPSPRPRAGPLVARREPAAPVRHTAAPGAAPDRRPRSCSHRFSPALLASSAILVDADDGRVLWELKAHERRPVASTTKIMTALLALRKLAPHDIVTVDPSVPRVPLVREGLRAGERVQAWKLFYSMLLYSGNDDALALAIAAGRGQVDVRASDERRGAAARAARHALHLAQRRRRPRQLLERVGSRGADAGRAPQPALRADRAHEGRARLVVAADVREDLRQQQPDADASTPARTASRPATRTSRARASSCRRQRHGHTLLAVVLDSANMYATRRAC